MPFEQCFTKLMLNTFLSPHLWLQKRFDVNLFRKIIVAVWQTSAEYMACYSELHGSLLLKWIYLNTRWISNYIHN